MSEHEAEESLIDTQIEQEIRKVIVGTASPQDRANFARLVSERVRRMTPEDTMREFRAVGLK